MAFYERRQIGFAAGQFSRKSGSSPMSAIGGKLPVKATWLSGPGIAEAVEKVPRTKIFETMIQNAERN